MATGLQELLDAHAQEGRVDWIGLRPERLAAMVSVAQVQLDIQGLQGDHARPGKRALTLIQAEHLPVIAALLGRDNVPPEILRRNVVVSRINLAALRGRQVEIGGAQIIITGPCAPCSRMQAALGPGGYNALRGHGGWCAEVERSGTVATGDSVRLVP